LQHSRAFIHPRMQLAMIVRCGIFASTIAVLMGSVAGEAGKSGSVQHACTTVPRSIHGLPTALNPNHLHLPPNTPPSHPIHSLPYPNSHDSPTASPQALDDALGSAPLLSTAIPESNVNRQ
jgi:hypothetical protein